MKLPGKTFIITGGASGLGEASARALAHEGAFVALFDLNEVKGKQVASEIGLDRALFVRTNITSEKEVKAAIAAVKAKFSQIDGLINAAGIGYAKKVVNSRGPHPLSGFNKVMDINVSGTFNLLRLAATEMASNHQDALSGERGVIINTASVAAFEGQIGQAAYAASKGAIVSMTLPIARELAPKGIRVITVAPGLFETPLLAGLPAKAQESLIKQTLFPKRLGKPSEFAELCVHISKNIMLNGCVIRLDGSIRMASM